MFRWSLNIVVWLILIFSSAENLAQSGTIVIPESADALENPITGDQKATIKGFKTYKKVCWVCHGDNGIGNGPEAAELEIKPADFNSQEVLDRTDGGLYWWIREGGNGMQPFKDILNSTETWELVNYVRYVQEKY